MKDLISCDKPTIARPAQRLKLANSLAASTNASSAC